MSFHRIVLPAITLSLLAARLSAAALPAMPPVVASDSLLIVAPHPDDESLCCGGLIHMAREAGARVSIVWITSGDAFRWDAMVMNHALLPRSASFRLLAQTRDAEARAAAHSLGVQADATFFLGFPDRGVLPLMNGYYQSRTPWRSRFTGASSVIYPDAFEPGTPYDGASLEREFTQLLDRVHPTLVLAPSPFDSHPDHRGASLLVSRALGARGELAELRYWIVHGGHGWPKHGFDPRLALTVAPRGAAEQWQELRLAPDSVDAKLRAISEHRTQSRVMGNVMRRYVRATELYAPSPPDGRRPH